MTENSHRQDMKNQQGLENGALDRALDAALAEFAAVEPRAGLEERILANLRIERKRAAGYAWWRWPAIATAAAVIVVALSIVWRSGRPGHNITAQHLPATTQTNEHSGMQIANNGGSGLTRPHEAPARRPNPHAASRPAPVLYAPKLDQFPSPQPLTEQEAILTRYVTNYPAHAALIAEARTEQLRRDSTEEMGKAASGTSSQQ
jgi:hypothetical protein